MAGSALVSVKTALIQLLGERPNLDGVQKSYGYPADESTRERERIWLGRVRLEHTPASMRAGRVFRNEEGDLDVVVEVEAVGESPQSADERALAIGLEIEEAVADNTETGNDPDNGITGLVLTVRGGDVDNAFNDKGSLTRIVYTLHWRARLT